MPRDSVLTKQQAYLEPLTHRNQHAPTHAVYAFDTLHLDRSVHVHHPASSFTAYSKPVKAPPRTKGSTAVLAVAAKAVALMSYLQSDTLSKEVGARKPSVQASEVSGNVTNASQIRNQRLLPPSHLSLIHI